MRSSPKQNSARNANITDAMYVRSRVASAVSLRHAAGRGQCLQQDASRMVFQDPPQGHTTSTTQADIVWNCDLPVAVIWFVAGVLTWPAARAPTWPKATPPESRQQSEGRHAGSPWDVRSPRWCGARPARAACRLCTRDVVCRGHQLASGSDATGACLLSTRGPLRPLPRPLPCGAQQPGHMGAGRFAAPCGCWRAGRRSGRIQHEVS